MTAGITLTWRRHELQDPKRDVHGLTRLPLLQATAAHRESEPQIEFPELPESPVDKALTLLRVAAQVEHALMVQYLYAGYSFGPTMQEIADVAVEEMSHLMTVQNLLRFVGAQPYLYRQDFGPPASADDRLFPFDFRLEPVTHVSLAKYVVAESPAEAPPGVDPAVLAHIAELALGPAHEPVNRVGTLYALLAAVFGNEESLGESVDPWFMAVSDLAAEAAVFYGGRDKLHLPDDAFRPASAPEQASDSQWDRSKVKSIDEFRVFVVASRREALEALRDIGLQGEGPSPIATETAHFRRFYNLFVTFFGADGLGTNPPPGVQPVPTGSQILLDGRETGEEQQAGDNVISHPTTVRWARLADLRYAILLGSLEHSLRFPGNDLAFLRGWCFAEMYSLRKLAELLRQMPRTATPTTAQVAALPFTLPPWLATGSRWSDLRAAFAESLTIAAELHDGAVAGSVQHLLLTHLLASDERKLAEATARATDGSTQRSRTDSVRDVLDWAAGAGNPGHDGQGRFWNLRRNELLQVSIDEANVMAPADPEAEALLIEMLRTRMPQSRPKLPTTGEEFLLIKSWVDENFPD
ncbi:ferritin-like domain-containing protein [Actinoplanes solisilvae]|uniref:ferritin-like domain-containing protein n=1 Tax=Actinoplanes solisilvae TaxID=2486853 RepID=UPI000FDA01D2|nr:ferritin-like domain-containing protein [Actinoplanes solisilvae]